MKVKYTDRKTNEQVLKTVREKRRMMHSIKKRRHCWIGHLLKHDSPPLTTFEGEILGRTQRGRKRHIFFDSMCEFAGVSTYGVAKRKAENRKQWRVIDTIVS